MVIEKNKQLKIGITDCGKFENYRSWLEMEPWVEVIRLSMQLQNVSETVSCDAILFSGGEDLHPELYGKPEYVKDFGLDEIIPARDAFEYEVLENALTLKKPLLGICRGLQLINVYLGGSLVPDIPRLHHSRAHGKISGQDQTHIIRVEPFSKLHEISGQELGMVNSAHHQSVDRPAADLKITAFSEPGIIEAMEWKEPGKKSWLLMVQWHPERMSDLSSTFSENIKLAFLESAKAV